MISCDQATVSRQTQDRVRELVQPRIPDFNVHTLFLNATHTHTAPNPTPSSFYGPTQVPGVITEAEFGEFMAARVADAAVTAWKNRRPAGISAALGFAVAGHNRRVEYLDGTSVMYGNTDTPHFRGLEGPSDHGVDMVFWTQDPGEPWKVHGFDVMWWRSRSREDLSRPWDPNHHTSFEDFVCFILNSDKVASYEMRGGV